LFLLGFVLRRLICLGPDPQLREALEYRHHRILGRPEELASANPNELPAEPLQDRLPCHIVGDLLFWMPSIAITFDRQPTPVAFDNHVDSVSTD
jgi:hypothetical protein